jgi:hypothetical protein
MNVAQIPIIVATTPITASFVKVNDLNIYIKKVRTDNIKELIDIQQKPL